MISQRAIDAIEASDTDELLRVVDGYCKIRDWDALEAIQVRCREAGSRGKQLWGVDEHIRYRLALEAPAERAALVLEEGRARFALGPLAEVAASTKTWAEMSPHLQPGPERMTFAAERVVRGERVDEDLELPGLQPWEPTYPVPTYKSDRIETPSPGLPTAEAAELPTEFETFDDTESEHALNDLIEPWITQSSGRSQTVTVRGIALDAIAALGPRRALITPLSAQEAMAYMAWAASSGGAHGDRRGAAAGRYLTWWVIATLADLDWPTTADHIGHAAGSFNWYWFDDNSPETGWVLRLVAEDPVEGLAWAISASDAAD